MNNPKLKGRQELGKILRKARRKGKRVVFTNGCFDLLHVGHIRYLRQAKRLGDLLVVGINRDTSVRRLKGPNRPIVPERQRAELLGALSCVDYVTLFGEETPQRLIEALLPDVLVKGRDWDPEKIVGRETVEKNGGRVATIRFVPGASTTGIIQKILQTHKPAR